ncbi:MAG: hypothetical protein KC657_39135 [Myxococcales bacterium]|nr:hypothetical protein [Myxococcales bacterium]
MNADDTDDERMVAYEGPPLKNERDRLLYYGSSLLFMNAEGDLGQFVPPPRVDHQQRMMTAFPELMPKMTADPSFGAVVGWSVEWARCGFPRVEIGHRLCASLMATSMGAEVVADIVVPWRAFAILIPSGVLAAEDAAGRLSHLTCAHAFHDRGKVRLIASAENLSVWSGAARDITELGEAGAAAGKRPDFVATPFDARDLRALQMIDRLFLGVCALLSSPDEQKAIARRFGQTRNRRRASPVPKAWTYRLKRDVTFDARALVHDYVAGGGRSPTVQSHVRGHWRRQHHGASLADVKWIQIEAYWRGPEDAAIAVRDHKVRA